ncbi:MAG: helicase-related protein [Streptococcus sp.]
MVATDVAARGLDISGVLTSTTTIFHKMKATVHRIGRTGRAGQSGQSTFVAPNEMGYLGIIENLIRNICEGLKPPTAQEAFQAKKKVALKKIERDFADEAIRSNFDKFKGDAVKLAQEFTSEELALYILSLIPRPRDNARSGNCT